jgi:hypothetical protein
MTKDQIKAVLDRVLTWPEQRQHDAAELLQHIEEQDNSPHQLTDDQLAEVRRRLAKPDAVTLTLGQLDQRLRRLGA